MTETDKVRDIINTYIKGTKEGNINLLRGIFSEKAVMSGNLPDVKLEAESPELFFHDIEGKKVSNLYKSTTGEIQVFGEIATASLKESELHGLNFINHFHLIKTSGEWKIISKLFTVE